MALAAVKVERGQGRLLSADIRVIRGKEFAESLAARNTENIGQHLKSIFAEGELAQDSVVKEFFTSAADGKNCRKDLLIRVSTEPAFEEGESQRASTHKEFLSVRKEGTQAVQRRVDFKALAANQTQTVDKAFEQAPEVLKKLPRPKKPKPPKP